MICSTVSLSLIPNFYLMIKAPNAILKLLAGAPISPENNPAYSAPNSDHGISSLRITHRLSSDNFPSNGSLNLPGGGSGESAGPYILCDLLPDGDARFFCHFTRFSCTSTGLCDPVIHTASPFRSSSASPNIGKSREKIKSSSREYRGE